MFPAYLYKDERALHVTVQSSTLSTRDDDDDDDDNYNNYRNIHTVYCTQTVGSVDITVQNTLYV
jgi:hypothetical protein